VVVVTVLDSSPPVVEVLLDDPDELLDEDVSIVSE